MTESASPEPLRTSRIVSILAGVGLVTYPIVAYFSLRLLSPRAAAAVMLLVLAPAVLPRLMRGNLRKLRGVAAVPLVSAGLLLLSFVLNSAGLVLFVPSAINLGLLLLFGTTLLGETPMIERFARLQDPDLNTSERQWCALWTWIWCAYFTTNALVASSLALTGEIGWWTTYTGLLSYIVMGCLFGVEYPLRKYRFGRFREHRLDQLLKRAFVSIRGQR